MRGSKGKRLTDWVMKNRLAIQFSIWGAVDSLYLGCAIVGFASGQDVIPYFVAFGAILVLLIEMRNEFLLVQEKELLEGQLVERSFQAGVYMLLFRRERKLRVFFQRKGGSVNGHCQGDTRSRQG